LQTYALARQVAPPQVPQDLQVVVYSREPFVILARRVMRTFTRYNTLALPGKFLDLVHNIVRHLCPFSIYGRVYLA
jgi:hypothetical protein